MVNIFSGVKSKINSFIASVLSVLGLGGATAPAFCQATCSAATSVAPLVGISLAATPLAFFNRYQTYIWWIAFSFLFILLVAHKMSRRASKIDKLLLVINSGLLLIGFPYFRNQFGQTYIYVGLAVIIFALLIFVSIKTYDFLEKRNKKFINS